jgi:hypothetical protein
MTARTVTQPSKAGALLWNWYGTTGRILHSFSIDYQSCESYRVESERGFWHLQRHPDGITEDELRHLNAFFVVMEEGEYHVSSRYIRNDRGNLGSGHLDERWTLSHVSSQAEFKGPLDGPTLTSNMLDSAAEVLANIHAYGLLYLERANHLLPVSPGKGALLTRFARISPKIYGSEGRPTGLERNNKHPLMLFRSLVPADRTQTTCVTVINNTDTQDPDSAFRQNRLLDADLNWQPEVSYTPLCYPVLMARVRRVLEELRSEELALGKPETIVHGNYGCENLVYDKSRIVRVIGWQGLRIGSPLLDLAHAWVILMIDWSKRSEPHDCDIPPDATTIGPFNRKGAQDFYERYLAVMKQLGGNALMSSKLGRAVQSQSLAKNYTRLACYGILIDQLESEAVSPKAVEDRIRAITQVLHVERSLW